MDNKKGESGIKCYICYTSHMDKPYCQKCKKTKAPSFVRTSVTSGGRQQHLCRKCNTERFRIYRRTEKGRAATYRAVTKSIAKFKNKQNARLKVKRAIKSGLLQKGSECFICKKKKKVEGHHPDYNLPLHVLWLCRQCHCLIHKKLHICG